MTAFYYLNEPASESLKKHLHDKWFEEEVKNTCIHMHSESQEMLISAPHNLPYKHLRTVLAPGPLTPEAA